MKCDLFTCVAFGFAAASAVANVILVEAESFTSSGGWKADMQSVEQIGTRTALHEFSHTLVTIPHIFTHAGTVRGRKVPII